MTLEFSTKYRELFTTKARYIHLWGGRGRGASFTSTQYFLQRLTSTTYFRGYFMREIFGDIRESLWRDFKDRIDENDSVNAKDIDLNESQMSAVCVSTGNMIMSKGFKKSAGNRTAKLKSLAGATHVIIEEAEEISEEDFLQLDDTLRSVKSDIQIIMLFNPPPKNHWIWKRWYILLDAPTRGANAAPEGYFVARPKKDPQLLSVFSTFEDNKENINESTLKQWSSYKTTNPDHFWTIIRALISEGARGRIYKGWNVIERMPGLYSKFYGLDWGFSGDPLAMVECEVHNRMLFADQKIYASGLTNDDLVTELTRLKISKSAPIVADNAQPKDIEDMRRRGWNFIACVKGPGSVQSGIKFIKQYQVFLTASSKEMWKENENYTFALDQHKEPTDEPIDKWNHAMDALNYAMDRVRNPSGVRVVSGAQSRTSNGRTNYSM